MIRSHPPVSLYGIDNPWPRLPGILLTTLLIWGALLWGFGLLLRQEYAGPPKPEPIDVQFMELPEPPQQVRPVEPPKSDILAQALSPAVKPRRETTHPRQREPAARPSSQPRPAVQEPASPAITAPPELSSPAEDADALTDPDQPGSRGYSQVARGGGAPDEPEAPGSSGAAYLRNPKPAYPARAKRMGLEGTVLLNVLVGREGKTLRTEVAQTSGHDILDEAAAEAVRSWQFIPARRGNALLEAWVQVPISFRLTR